METPLASLPLSVRVINTLEDRDVILLEHLAAQTYESLMAMPNLGEKTLEELCGAFAALGLPSPAWERPPRPAKPMSPRGERAEEGAPSWNCGEGAVAVRAISGYCPRATPSVAMCENDRPLCAWEPFMSRM